MEQPLALLDSAGFSSTQAFWLLQSVLHYSVGFVIEGQHRRDYAASYDPAAPTARFDATAPRARPRPVPRWPPIRTTSSPSASIMITGAAALLVDRGAAS